ncbi:hypothetical protein [Kineococcus terrestris]|uniref:hypothetical protein n=1 Tax=Kineococcus terrestris TaxID=2044856 RepID=UPI0034DB2E77
MSPRASVPRRHLPTSPFQPAPPAPRSEEFAPGDRVTHDRHGMGTVVSVEVDDWCTVRFSSGELRRVPGLSLGKL